MGQIFVAFLLIVEVVCAFLLIGVILLQKSKGGGLGGTAFGGGGGDSLFGARTGSVLTKITITLSIVFLANTLVLAFVYAGPRDASLMDRHRTLDIRPVEPPPADLPATATPAPVPVDADMDMVPFEMPVDPTVLDAEIGPEAEPVFDLDAVSVEALPDLTVEEPPVEMPPVEEVDAAIAEPAPESE